MKIAMIGQKGVPSRAGGIEIHVEQLAKRLVQYGHGVHVFCRSGYVRPSLDATDKKDATNAMDAGDAAKITKPCRKSKTVRLQDGVFLHFTPYIASKHLEAITHTFTSTLKAIFLGCDVFHYHALGPSALAFIPRLLGKKVVCTVHGLDWRRAKWGRLATALLKLGELSTARFSHRTISVSESLVKYYREKYKKDIAFIPNGIERPIHREAEIIKGKYGLQKDGYILFLGRLVPEKGVHYLIKAYQLLKTGKKLVIAGGDSHSEGYVKQLKAQASGCANILFTGFVEGRELDELYSNAYLYVLPSDIEGMPLSLLEAMSYGNCCLVSDIAENVAVTGHMGITFRRGDWLDLLMKLNALLLCPEKVRGYRERSPDYILNRFNWDRSAQRTLKIYEALA